MKHYKSIFVYIVICIIQIYSLAEKINFSDGSYLSGVIVKETRKYLYINIASKRCRFYKRNIVSIKKSGKSRKIFHKIINKRDASLTKKIKSLVKKKQFHVLPNLLQYLKLKNSDIQMRVVASLKYIPYKATVALLFNFMRKKKYRYQAVESIVYLAKKHKNLKIHSLFYNRVKYIKTFRNYHISYIHFMEKSHKKRYRTILEKHLQSDNKAILLACIKALGELKQVEKLPEFLDIEDISIKKYTIKALAKSENMDYVPLIIPFLNIDETANTAYWSLKYISGQKFPKNITIWEHWWENIESLKEREENIADTLRIGTEIETQKILKKLCNFPYTIKRPEYFSFYKIMLKIAKEETGIVWEKTIEALKNFPANTTTKILIELLDIVSKQEQKHIIKALESITNLKFKKVKSWKIWKAINKHIKKSKRISHIILNEAIPLESKVFLIKKLNKQRMRHLDTYFIELLKKYDKNNELSHEEMYFFKTTINIIGTHNKEIKNTFRKKSLKE